MKLIRILLFVFAGLIGGLLGYYLLLGFDYNKMIRFFLGCIVLGYVFHAVDTWIMKK